MEENPTFKQSHLREEYGEAWKTSIFAAATSWHSSKADCCEDSGTSASLFMAMNQTLSIVPIPCAAHVVQRDANMATNTS